MEKGIYEITNKGFRPVRKHINVIKKFNPLIRDTIYKNEKKIIIWRRKSL